LFFCYQADTYQHQLSDITATKQIRICISCLWYYCYQADKYQVQFRLWCLVIIIKLSTWWRSVFSVTFPGTHGTRGSVDPTTRIREKSSLQAVCAVSAHNNKIQETQSSLNSTTFSTCIYLLNITKLNFEFNWQKWLANVVYNCCYARSSLRSPNIKFNSTDKFAYP
jgi:hypothetical protein